MIKLEYENIEELVSVLNILNKEVTFLNAICRKAGANGDIKLLKDLLDEDQPVFKYTTEILLEAGSHGQLKFMEELDVLYKHNVAASIDNANAKHKEHVLEVIRRTTDNVINVVDDVDIITKLGELNASLINNINNSPVEYIPGIVSGYLIVLFPLVMDADDRVRIAVGEQRNALKELINTQ